jgi:DUF218 domain
MADVTTPTDINLIVRFLAHSQISNLSQSAPVDCLVLCGSAILHCAETVFSALEAQPHLAKTLIICGGIGHSTPHLYEAVAQTPRYNSTVDLTPDSIHGRPESHVLKMIFEKFYDVDSIVEAGCKIILEDRSTNCGANASETRKVLEAYDIPTPKTFIIVQEPTMSLRTLAAFRKTYTDLPDLPTFKACPTFVPQVHMVDGKLEYANSNEGPEPRKLWEMGRFCDLVLGEIPRLRDDSRGYGPKGRGFIDHVDVPEEVERAWTRLRTVILGSRTTLRN